MELAIGVAMGLVILVLLVVVHELGHALVARRNGVIVEEFGIGFPPKAWARKLKNGILFSINWLPIGGFVKLQGEHDAASNKGDYGAATFWQKTKILFAGVIINWLVAVLLLSVLAYSGLPKILSNQFVISGDTTTITQSVEIGSLTSNLPAEKAGLKTHDKILRFAGQEVPSIQALIDLTKSYKGTTVQVMYSRAGTEAIVDVQLRDDEAGSILGAGLDQPSMTKSTWSAPIVGLVTTGQFTLATIEGLGDVVGNLVSGLLMQLSPNGSTRTQGSDNLERAGGSLSGPVGILGTIFPEAEQAGPTQLIFLTAIISLTLAVMNILPIPALDGGRWFTTLIYKLLRRPLTKDTEEKIQATGFLILMGLVLLVTIGDVVKLF